MIRFGLVTSTIERRIERDLITKLDFDFWMETLLLIS